MACVPPLELWCSGNAKDWRDALALEEEAIASVAKRGGRKAKLPALNARLSEITPGMTSISKEQLCKLMEWKLTRGKMRPLMRFITALDEEKVLACTKKGFQLAKEGEKNLKQAVEALSEMKGVGTATASLLLNRFDPKSFPFMSDEILVAVGSRERVYTLSRYIELARDVGKKAESLNLSCCDIERAIWTSSILSSNSGGDSPKKKRKRS